MEKAKSARSLISRAERHFLELKKLIEEFERRNPHELSVIDRPKEGYLSLISKLNRPIPEEIPCTIFDLVNCLRSALDHIVYSCSCRIKKGNNLNQTKFPFADSTTALLAEFKRGGRDVPVNLQKFLISFNPVKGGDEVLWSLNKLRNQKIHRILAPAVVHLQSIRIGKAGSVEPGYVMKIAVKLVNQWDSENSQLEIMQFKDPSGDIDVVANPELAFSDFSGFPKLSIAETMKKCIEKVRCVVEDIELFTNKLLNEGVIDC